MGSTINISENNFEAEVLKSDIPVLVDFWADWCGPCKMIAPTIEELSEEYAGRAKICKLDVQQNQSLAESFAVSGIPTLIMFSNGKAEETLVGVQPKETLQKLIEKYL